MEFPTISRSGITDDNSRLFPEIPTGVGTLYIQQTEAVSRSGHEGVAVLLPGFAIIW